MIPLFKSRCGWCHERDTIIDRWADNGMPAWIFWNIVVRFDKLTRRPAIWWHRRFHDH